MTQKLPCRRCLLAEIDPEGLAAAVQKRIALLPAEERAGAEEYARRLAFCKACDLLSDGICAACGCYAELRAAKIAQHCPCEKHMW